MFECHFYQVFASLCHHILTLRFSEVRLLRIMLIVSKFPNFTCLYKDSILHHNQSTRFNQSKKGVRFQLDDLPPPTTQVYNQQSDQKPKQNKSSSLDKTQIKFQVKEAYVMKGGRKEFKNVLILCETRDGKIEIGWSNRAEDSPFRRHSM